MAFHLERGHHPALVGCVEATEAVSSPFGAASLFSMPLPQSQLFAFSERIIWHLAGQFPRQ